MKEDDHEGEKVENNWVDGEVLHLITLQGEMELEFAKNAKKQSKFTTTKGVHVCQVISLDLSEFTGLTKRGLI
jgi:hypothetical protein